MQVNDKHIKDRIIEVQNKKFKVLSFDTDNLYPQKVEKLINGSGTAKNCTNRLSSFLSGKGLTNKVLENLIINNTSETLYDVLNACINDYSKYRGFAVWRKINDISKSVEFYHVPFEWVRKVYSVDSEDFTAKFAIYNNWDGKKGKQNIDDIQYAWNFTTSEDAILEQVLEDGSIDMYSGQLYYYSADGEQYPLSWIDPIQEDCVVDNQMKIFNYKNITTNFMASHFVLFRNEPERVEKDAIMESLKTAQSAENASKILALWGITKDDFELVKIDVQNHDKLFDLTNTTTKDNIREQFGQNLPFFKGGGSSADMSGEAIKTTYSFYNALTENDRKNICKVFKKLINTWYKPVVDDIEIDILTFGV